MAAQLHGFYTNRNGKLEFIRKVDKRAKFGYYGKMDNYNKYGEAESGSNHDLVKEGFSYKDYKVSCSFDEKTEIITLTLFTTEHYLKVTEALSGFEDLFDWAIRLKLESQNSVEVTVEEKGKATSYKPMIDLMSDNDVEINIADEFDSLEDQFIAVMSNDSSLSDEVTTDTQVEEIEGLSEAFENAKAKIIEYNSITKAKPTSMIGKLLYNNDKAKKDLDTKKSTIKNQLDKMFGVVQLKYELLLSTGEQLQHSCSQAMKQLLVLEKMQQVSQLGISKYQDAESVPMRALTTNTQIINAVEETKEYILKVKGIIIIAQKTAVEIGSNLPTMKTALARDISLVKLTNVIDNCQKACKVTADTTRDVKSITSAKVQSDVLRILTEYRDDNSEEIIMKNTAISMNKFSEDLVKVANELGTKTRRVADLAISNQKEAKLGLASKTVLKLGMGADSAVNPKENQGEKNEI